MKTRLGFFLCASIFLLNLTAVLSATANSAAPQIDRSKASSGFDHAGAREGVEIWRVEKFAPVRVAPENYGKFHEGDSYIILETVIYQGRKTFTIYYWLGKDTSLDESGAAASLTVFLDNLLGGTPVQRREIQGKETREFKKLFPDGIKYLPGGIDSGFNHVTPNAPDTKLKLYQVKGKRDIFVRLIEPKASAMNNGDSYILDTGKTIYVYNGKDSNKQERLKAVSAANQIRDKDHSGRARVEIIDEHSTPEEVDEFFKALGGGNRVSLAQASIGGDDDSFTRNADSSLTLYKISDQSGSLKSEKVNEKSLSKNSLNTNDAYVLDATTSVFVWNGRKATKAEKAEAKKMANEILRTKNYPSWVPVIPVIEGGEPTTFKQYFTEWRSELDMQGLGRG